MICSKREFFGCIFAFGLAAAAKAAVPVMVKDGIFLKDGQPFRAYGINYFGAFYHKLGIQGGGFGSSGKSPGSRSYLEAFRVFKSYGIPFFRCPISGFYPRDWKVYLTDPSAYFQMLDQFVSDVESEGLLLVPTFFWMPQSLPVALDEPVGAWGDPSSKTRQTLRTMTAEIVRRYRNSPAILGWEFSNEFLLESDLPGRVGKKEWWNATVLGFPPAFRAEDELSRRQIREACREFAQTVRSLDKERPIFTGDAFPRASANALMSGKGWKADAPQDWFGIFDGDNPSPVDTVTVHWYHDTVNQAASNRPPEISQEELIAGLMGVGRKLGKPLFVGEFGCQSDLADPAERKRQTEALLRILLKNEVQLAAYWVYDYPSLPTWHCVPGGENAFALEMLREANQRLKAIGKPDPCAPQKH